MEKGVVFAILVVILFILGCSSSRPDIVCNSPYIRHAAGCCLDRNSNQLCDDDEAGEEKPFFVEPDYAPAEETAVAAGETPATEETGMEEPVYEVTSPTGEKLEATYIATKDEVRDVPSKYQAAVPKLQGWKAENSHMSLEITKIVIDVNPIEKRTLTSPDKEAYLKEIYLTITNKDYENYLNPEMVFRLGDSKDPLVLVKTLHCDRFDPIPMEGCKNALPETEAMQVRMDVDKQLPRVALQYTLKLTLQNRRDEEDKNMLKIEKTFDPLDLYGATYI
jgi:hypothetical protein